MNQVSSTPPLALSTTPDSHSLYLSSTCLDLLLIEMVALAQRLSSELSSKSIDEDEEKDAIYTRLESLGFRVGQGVVERSDLNQSFKLTSRFARDKPRFIDSLDVIKFVCKDLWIILFKKQIDNLKTNHRGVFVLTDNSFRWFSRMSTKQGGQEAVNRAQPFLWFPCGVIRGVLSNLGVSSHVVAETTGLPTCTFQIKISNQ
ncbi:Trafficking protein particle complex subunit 6B [Neolecta irregularis DAH-3]|uniref:Trafficking protein particle complex subunit 6B n=1 Tax=Neolecta irregularis (strain DAH-3) TaxID=1198029 RepID=A0A1U7LWF4_NEOID|nr:Trafficking protein particle complex subunit 6B [Neolecta irregularis DAH-3]|eukprot:OLL27010.1 Trafficking protein particle complex subunit 6B [Neolecta irregularis DAH-3]